MGIRVLRWPNEAALRARLKAVGIPRIVILEDESIPPDRDAMEELVRYPVDSGELLERVRRVEEVSRVSLPVLDSSGILYFGGRWTGLSPSSVGIMQALLARYPSVVPRGDLMEEVWPVRKPSRNAMDLQMLRLRRRVAMVGLGVRTVTGKGYLLHLSEDRDAELNRV